MCLRVREGLREDGMPNHVASLLAIVWMASVIGCQNKEDQLEHVARDWSLTIRASQVIPVYPLTEDVQPGDIYLVRTRTDDQVAVYNKRGFLPLENLLHRLRPEGYDAIYEKAYHTDGG